MTARSFGASDRRALPVSVVLHDDEERIAALFDGRRLPVARSVYFAVVRLASEAAGEYGEATRKELAGRSGVSVRTLDEFTAALEAGGLIHRVQRREDGVNLPNLYALGPAPGGVAQETALPPSDSAQRSSSTSREEGKKGDGGGLSALPLPDGIEVPDELRSDAEALLRSKKKVDGHLVTPEEMAKVVVAIAAVNRCSASEFGVGAHLTAVVMRIRERPSMSADKHQRLVESAWRIKWWERSGRGRRPTPAVIYGNERVFEQVVQDAVDEAAGRDPDVQAQAKRFTRSD